MKRQPAKTTTSIAKVLLASCFLLAGVIEQADAQQQRRSFFELLFGRREPAYAPLEPQPPPRRVVPRPQRKRPAQAAVAARPTVTQPETPPQVEKLENAKTILVVGDFLASGLGDGLDAAFEASPGVVVAARGNVASGLVRRDYYNWQQQLPQMLAELKPAMVVVMIGANDRQQIIDDTLKEKFGTDVWFMAYEARVQAFAKAVTGQNIPLICVGLPPFDSPAMSADATKLNQLYRSQVESVGGQFVDIWDGFTDEDGKFVITGSDVNGQQVRLRTADGINLTQAGRRKVAFYVEKPARHLLGDQASPDIARLETGPSGAPLLPSEATQPMRSQPISVSDPDLDGGAELLGGAKPLAREPQSPRDLLVERGEMAAAPKGRVDYYVMPDAPAATDAPDKKEAAPGGP
jgi:hypothetical protein